jgi:hypothetical protein
VHLAACHTRTTAITRSGGHAPAQRRDKDHKPHLLAGLAHRELGGQRAAVQRAWEMRLLAAVR